MQTSLRELHSKTAEGTNSLNSNAFLMFFFYILYNIIKVKNISRTKLPILESKLYLCDLGQVL